MFPLVMTPFKNGVEMLKTEQQAGWQAGRRWSVAAGNPATILPRSKAAEAELSRTGAGPWRHRGFYWQPVSALLLSGNLAIGSCQRHLKQVDGISVRLTCMRSSREFDFFSTPTNSRVTAAPRAELQQWLQRRDQRCKSPKVS